MQDGVYAFKTIPAEQAAPAGPSGISLLWPALATLALVLLAGAAIARLVAGPRLDGILLFAAGSAGVVFAAENSTASCAGLRSPMEAAILSISRSTASL